MVLPDGQYAPPEQINIRVVEPLYVDLIEQTFPPAWVKSSHIASYSADDFWWLPVAVYAGMINSSRQLPDVSIPSKAWESMTMERCGILSSNPEYKPSVFKQDFTQASH
jgi:hypothetical protein